MIFGGYKASKLKPQLKMAVTRFQIASNKVSLVELNCAYDMVVHFHTNATPPLSFSSWIGAELTSDSLRNLH